MSFNGGKDCTVLLHLVIAVMNSLKIPVNKLLVIYFRSPHEFPEVSDFIKEVVNRYIWFVKAKDRAAS